MPRESKPFIYNEAVHTPADVGLSYIYPFFVGIGIPPRYLKISQDAERTAKHGAYSYTFVEVHPKETDTDAGHLQFNVLKDTDPTYPDVNGVEYIVENAGRRDKDTRDGEAIARILATHGQSGYEIQIDPQRGVTQVIVAQQSLTYGMLPHLDKEHRLVGLRFTPNLCGDQPPLRITTMVGDVDMLAVPAVRVRRSRLAIASGLPSG